MITLIDNYDSFTFNLYHELLKKNDVQIFKNDEIYETGRRFFDDGERY